VPPVTVLQSGSISPIVCNTLNITIQNGQVKFQGNITGDIAQIASVATFECNTDYDITKNSTLECTVNGWSGTAPTCGEQHIYTVKFNTHVLPPSL